MAFWPSLLNRTKFWIADRLGLHRVFAATRYLLVRQLNTDPPSEGPAGNRHLQDAFLDLCVTLQPNILLDVGANDGSASLAVRKVVPGCEVHAFEANPHIHAKHLERLQAQGVRYWNLAVTDCVGHATLYAPLTLSRAYIRGEVVPASILEGEDTGKTSLLRRNEEATYAEFKVEATTLDAFADTHLQDWRHRNIFLWVDAEGAADRVLVGAKRLLARTRVIFLETEGFDFWKDQADRVAVVSQLIRFGFLPVARDREYGDKQFNILFVHQDAIDRVLPQIFNRRAALQLCRETEKTPEALPHSYISVGAVQQADIPVFIPCFNAVTYARSMVEQLRARGLRRLILVDNASTYPPMRDYLASPGSGVTVVALATNKGPNDVFLDPVNFALLPQFFCVTDPDLLLNPEMPEDFVAQLAALTERFSIGKAGLAIDIADHGSMRQQEFNIGEQLWKIWDWEKQFWKDQLASLPGGDPVFRADIDTTFAVYNKRFFNTNTRTQAVRVAGRFTCRHLPWYLDIGLPAEEEAYYRIHAQHSYYLRADIASK
jgi:FkbM family methyltransferase